MSTEAINQSVRRAGSHFYLAMRLMPPDRRAAMFAIYAFARALDDVADGPGSPDDKRRALSAWRDELARIYAGQPTTPIGKALSPVAARYGLPRAEFQELIAGMEMDVSGEMRAPPLERLELYCRRVAGSVGLLALPVFGCHSAAERAFAVRLGQALQLTNIVRDTDEDAARHRLYLPREILDAAGIPGNAPEEILAHPHFTAAWQETCNLARRAFSAADSALAECPHPRRLWPALMMMGIYRRLLARLSADGGPAVTHRRIELALQLWIALRSVVLARA